ncbi:MAG: hypothetical protein BMS9Abin10_0393 [Gammaproteobacteria bacterium]|nr:MAG: hypothetical protein BMS9Abin10_0393 [Gammaproteobacteria bacterium]
MLVSVLLPVYNGSAFLSAAIRSMQRQSFREFEFVVVDDGSTDATPEIVLAMAAEDKRIRYIRKSHGGIVSALNHGLESCPGKYVARMDCDDIALRKRLAIQLAFMERHPEIAACGMAIRKFQGRAPLPWRTERFPETPRAIATRLLFNSPLMHPTVMIRREVLQEIGAYRPEYEWAEDYELWSRLTTTHRVTNLPQVGVYYRRSSGTVSERHAARQIHVANKIRYENLVKLFGAAVADQCWPLHEELSARQFSEPSRLRELAKYMAQLIADIQLDSAVLSNVWLGYCVRRADLGMAAYRAYKAAAPRRLVGRELLLAALCSIHKRYPG